MPRRRDPRSTADSPPPRRPLRAAAVAAAGAAAALALLALIWPQHDKPFRQAPKVTAATLADKPRRPVTVLLIGIDGDRLGAASNGAAPAGPANADALVLLRVQPQGPLQVLNLPTELAVRIPGQKHPVSLGSLYRSGGAALTADAVRELTGLQAPAPDRYVVLPRAALRRLINGIGGLEIDPPRTMRYQDKAQKLKIDLQGGLQRLGGAQVEQLVRFRDPSDGEVDRRRTQQRMQVALRERLRQSEPLAVLPSLLRDLEEQVQTNLTPGEALSLLAAGLDDQQPIDFATLPLDPARPAHGQLRQLSAGSPNPLWPQGKP